MTGFKIYFLFIVFFNIRDELTVVYIAFEGLLAYVLMDLQHPLKLALYWDGHIQYYPDLGFIGPIGKIVTINHRIRFGDLLSNIHSYIGVDTITIDLKLICKYPDHGPWGFKFCPLLIMNEEGMDLIFSLAAEYPNTMVHLYIVRESVVNCQEGNNIFTSKEMAPYVNLLTQDVESPILPAPTTSCTQSFLKDKHGAQWLPSSNNDIIFRAMSSMSPSLKPIQSSLPTPLVSRNALEYTEHNETASANQQRQVHVLEDDVGCSSLFQLDHNREEIGTMRTILAAEEPIVGAEIGNALGITDVIHNLVQNEASLPSRDDAFIDAEQGQSDEDSDCNVEVENEQCTFGEDNGRTSNNVTFSPELPAYNPPGMPFYLDIGDLDKFVVTGRGSPTRIDFWSENSAGIRKHMRFSDKEQLMMAVRLWSMEQCREFQVQESRSTAWKVKCLKSDEGCKWQLRACLKATHKTWEVTKLISDHTCISMASSNDHRHLQPRIIARKIVHFIKNDALTSVKQVQLHVKKILHYDVSYKKV